MQDVHTELKETSSCRPAPGVGEEVLSILDIVEDTTVDGPGFRTAIYAAGCRHACAGCHNPESWDIRRGTPVAVSALVERILADEFANVTFTGGDPMFQPEGFAALAREIRRRSPKTIWCYTGFRYEDLLASPARLALLREIDVLVDGRFEQALRSEEVPFRGSTNQRLIDVPRSLREGRVVLYELSLAPF